MPGSDYDRPSKRRRRDFHSPEFSIRKEQSYSARESRDDRASSDERTRRFTRRRSPGVGRGSNERSMNSDGEREHRTREKEPREGSRDRDSGRRSHYKRLGRSRSPQASGSRHRHHRRDRDRDEVRDDRRHGNRQHDREPRDKTRSHRRSPSPRPFQRSKAPLPSQNDAFVAESDPSSALDKPVEKQKPNFGLSGKLAAASNTVQTANQTIVLKYHEPSEARKPPARDQWRLYVFKDDEILETVELSEQSCWLFGREAAVADFPIEHASCSKQHAVIQFRYIDKRNEFRDKIGKVKPYVIDLESANGTTVNDNAVPAAKYMELMDKDVLKFGHSSREYVIQLPSSK